MVSALQQFFDSERRRRGWSMRDTAKRCQISASKAYAIVNGDDNVEFETFENIATAFGMTPAELAVVIGKGAPGEDPQRTTIQAVLREVPEEDLGTVERIVRSFMRARTRSATRANTRNGGTSTTSSHGRTGEDAALEHRKRCAHQLLTPALT